MSSMILSKPVDVTKYGCIYFGVQKNVAPAGMAIAIVRERPAGPRRRQRAHHDELHHPAEQGQHVQHPAVLVHLHDRSGAQVSGNDIGGLANMQKINEAKAKVLYDYLDGQDFFNNPVEHRYRSTMNVTFTSPDPDLDKKFCAEAADAGFVNLKGHRLVGGMRASIYNAMPAEGIDKLVDFMEKFRKENA